MEKHLRSGPLPGADGVSLYHTLPDYAQLVFGWDVTATLDFEEDKTMVLCCDQTMAGIGLDYFEGLLDRIARHLQLCYGIGYLRPFNLGPSIYAAGMNTTSDYSDEAMAEAHRIGSWFRERIGENRHRTGHLRDVYPLNVISAPHLSQRVDGLALSDWIGRESWRGTLRTLPGEAAVWRIEEAHVERVRAELIPTGLLIAYPPAKQ